MTTCNAARPDPEKEAAMQNASELIDAATKLGAELRANRFTVKGYELALWCRSLSERLVSQIYGPDEGAKHD